MDDAVRQTLIELRRERGVSLLKDPDRLEAHLRDMAPGIIHGIVLHTGAVVAQT